MVMLNFSIYCACPLFLFLFDRHGSALFLSMFPKRNHTHKFGAIRTEVDDHKFSSKLEAKYYQRLKLLQQTGEVLFFLLQVPFHLPGGTKYVTDFQVFYSDGRVEFIDTKGVMTPMSSLKIKQVESIYPVEIKIVSK